MLNPEGGGPLARVVVITDEDGQYFLSCVKSLLLSFNSNHLVPSAPSNLSVGEESSTSALVSWSRPLRPNGVIAGYRLYFLQGNSTQVVTLHSRDTRVSHRLQRLRPATSYQVWVKAFTPQHEGNPSSHTDLITEPRRPAIPTAISIKCLEPAGLFVAWRGEAELYMARVGEQKITVAGQELNLANLTIGEEYEVEVRAGVESVHRRGEVRWGAWSPKKEVTLGPNCSEEPALDRAVLIGVFATLLLLATVAVCLLIYRRFCVESYYYLEEASVSSSPSTRSLSGQSGKEEEGQMTPGQFLLHLELVHREERAGLRAELAGVLASLQPCQNSSSDWVEGWDTHQHLVPRERPTATALWQAVRKECVTVVVELEDECPKYAPDSGERRQYGETEVTSLSMTRLGSYSHRRMRVANREVILLQLTTTPAPLALLSLARAARSAGGREGRVMVVGACAGLYTVLDVSLRQLRARGTVGAGVALRQAAVAGRVLVAREDELSLLLTSLGEAVCAGETWVRQSYLPRYVSGLVATEGEALARQWSLVVGRGSGRDSPSLPTGATWLPGLHSPSEFLLASPPCPAATPQFWRLLWDCGVHTVLVLGAGPLQGAAGEDGVTVTHWEDELSSQGRAQNYVMEDQQGGRRVVRLLQQDSFLSSGSPPETALALADCVHARQDQLPRAPTLIVAAQAEPAAAFCSLSTLMRQLEAEQAVDVYAAARGVESLLPGAFPSPASLLRIYRALETRLASPPTPYSYLQPPLWNEKMI